MRQREIIVNGNQSLWFPADMPEEEIHNQLVKGGYAPIPESDPGLAAPLPDQTPGRVAGSIAPTAARVVGGIAGGLIGARVGAPLLGAMTGGAVGDAVGQGIEIVVDHTRQGYNWLRTVSEAGLNMIPGLSGGKTLIGKAALSAVNGMILAPISLSVTAGVEGEAQPSPMEFVKVAGWGGLLSFGIGAAFHYTTTRAQDNLAAGKIVARADKVMEPLGVVPPAPPVVAPPAEPFTPSPQVGPHQPGIANAQQLSLGDTITTAPRVQGELFPTPTVPGDASVGSLVKAMGGIEPGSLEVYSPETAVQLAPYTDPSARIPLQAQAQKAFEQGFIDVATPEELVTALHKEVNGELVQTVAQQKINAGGLIPYGHEGKVVSNIQQQSMLQEGLPSWLVNKEDRGPFILNADSLRDLGKPKLASQMTLPEFHGALVNSMEKEFDPAMVAAMHREAVVSGSLEGLPVSQAAIDSAGLTGRVAATDEVPSDKVMRGVMDALQQSEDPKDQNRLLEIYDTLHNEKGYTSVFTDTVGWLADKGKWLKEAWTKELDLPSGMPEDRKTLMYGHDAVTNGWLNLTGRVSEVLTKFGNEPSAMLGHAMLRVQKNSELDAGAATGAIQKIFARDLTEAEGLRVWRAKHGFLDVAELSDKESHAFDQVTQLFNQVAVVGEHLGAQGEFNYHRWNKETGKLEVGPWQARDAYAPINLKPGAFDDKDPLFGKLVSWLETDRGMKPDQARSLLAVEMAALGKKSNALASLEKSRTDINWPEWARVQDPLSEWSMYFDRAWKRLHMVHEFGQDLGQATGPNGLINQIAAENKDLGQYATRAFERFAGLSPTNELSKIMQGVGLFEAVTKLSPRTALAQTGQVGMAVVRTNIKSVVKALGNYRQSEEIAHGAGALLRSVRQQAFRDLAGPAQGGVIGNAMDTVLKYYGIKALDSWARVTASGAGHFYADELIDNLVKNPQSARRSFWTRRLEQMGVDVPAAMAEKVNQLNGGPVTDAYTLQLRTAAQTVNADVNFRNGMLDLPEQVIKHPIAARFKTFMYQAGRFHEEYTMKELVKHGNPQPLIYALTVGGVLNEAIQDVSALISGQPLDERGGLIARTVSGAKINPMDVFRHYSAGGALGMFDMVHQAVSNQGRTAGFFMAAAPPEMSDVYYFSEAIRTALNRYEANRNDWLDPIGKQVLYRVTTLNMAHRHGQNLGLIDKPRELDVFQKADRREKSAAAKRGRQESLRRQGLLR